MGREMRGREIRKVNGSMHPLGFSKVGAYDFGHLAPFLRHGDLLAETHLTPSLGVNPFDLLDDLSSPKTGVPRLSVGEATRD